MKILAFITDPEKISWVTVEGSQAAPKLGIPKLQRIKADVETGKGLLNLLRTIELLIDTERPARVSILQAGKSKFANASSARPRMEAVIQIACAQKGLEATLFSPITMAAKLKKLENSGRTLEGIFNGGLSFSPQDSISAVGVGFISLH